MFPAIAKDDTQVATTFDAFFYLWRGGCRQQVLPTPPLIQLETIRNQSSAMRGDAAANQNAFLMIEIVENVKNAVGFLGNITRSMRITVTLSRYLCVLERSPDREGRRARSHVEKIKT
jgi:hypothetical protein